MGKLFAEKLDAESSKTSRGRKQGHVSTKKKRKHRKLSLIISLQFCTWKFSWFSVSNFLVVRCQNDPALFVIDCFSRDFFQRCVDFHGGDDASESLQVALDRKTDFQSEFEVLGISKLRDEMTGFPKIMRKFLEWAIWKYSTPFKLNRLHRICFKHGYVSWRRLIPLKNSTYDLKPLFVQFCGREVERECLWVVKLGGRGRCDIV